MLDSYLAQAVHINAERGWIRVLETEFAGDLARANVSFWVIISQTLVLLVALQHGRISRRQIGTLRYLKQRPPYLDAFLRPWLTMNYSSYSRRVARFVGNRLAIDSLTDRAAMPIIPLNCLAGA